MNIRIALGVIFVFFALPWAIARVLKPKHGHCPLCGASLHTEGAFNWHGAARCQEVTDSMNAEYED